MAGKRPPDVSPWEWQEYLRRFPRMSWWLRQADGDHPDYPRTSQNSRPMASLFPQSPLPPQRSFLASSTSHRSSLPMSPSPFDSWADQQSYPRASTPPSRDAPSLWSQNVLDARPTTSQSSPPPSRWGSSRRNDTTANPQMVTVSIPLNTTIVGSPITRRELRIPSNLIFADFFSRVCANMDVKPEDASIGYKYHNDRARDPPRRLSNEDEYAAMMAEMVRKVLAARSRNPVLLLHNLRPAIPTPSSKRKCKDDENGQDVKPQTTTTLDFTREFRELRSRLSCQLHNDRPCRIDPITSKHEELTVYQITLWARMIAKGEATYTQPPNSSGFDHVRKRRRVQSSDQTPHTHSIHVHFPSLVSQPQVSIVPAGPSSTPPPKPATVTALSPTETPADSPHSSPSQSIIDLTNDLNEIDSAIYPTVGELLGELDETMPGLGFARYEERLLKAGFTHVHHVTDMPDVQQKFDQLEIPVGTGQEIFERATRMIRRAGKSKQITKAEEDNPT